MTDTEARLRSVVAGYAAPDPSTLATLPKGGANLSYMGHAEVTLALIDVDPLWTWEPLAIDPETGGPLIATQGNRLVMWGKLTVHGKSIIGVGTCEARKGDPEKELIGDFLRNAAMRFGIGTKLWSKATDADPVSHGAAGGYDKRRQPEPAPDAVAVLFDRIASYGKGDPQLGAAIKAECEQWGCKFTLPEFRKQSGDMHRALERLVDEWPHMVDATVDTRTVA